MNRYREPRFRLALLTVVFALIAAACGGGESTTTAEQTSSTAGGASELSGTVRWTMLNYDDGVQAWIDDIVAGFGELHPNVTIEATMPATNQYQDLITTQVQGGNPPDISAMATAWVPAFADAGELENWSDHLDDALLSRFEQTLLEGAEYGDELVSLPYLATARALFYNMDALEAVGAEAPATWDELVDVAADISESDAGMHGFALQGAGVETFAAWFPYTYWASGGEFIDAQGNLAVDSAACVEAVSILNDLVQSGGAQPDVTSYDLPEQMGAFSAGDAAMTITGPWLVPSLEADAPDLSYGVAPVPGGSGGQYTLGVQDAFVLWRNGGNTEAAVELMKYIFEAENADALVEGRGMLPVLTEGFDAERYQDGPLKTFVETLPTARFAPQDPAWNALMETGTQALQDMYVNATSPEDTCAQIVGGSGGL